MASPPMARYQGESNLGAGGDVQSYACTFQGEREIEGGQGAHDVNPLGLFLRTFIPFILHILSVFLPA